MLETFGPLEGYRIQLTIIRQAEPMVTGPRAGQLERYTIQQYVDILPTAESIGQDVEVALSPGWGGASLSRRTPPRDAHRIGVAAH